MNYRGIQIEDTYCECTDIYNARLLLTAATEAIALHEAAYLCGWSIITAAPIQGCVEGVAPAGSTPDGRPGVLIQMNAPTPVGLPAFCRALLDRLYILPHLPTCSLYNATVGHAAATSIDAAEHVRRWGDGFDEDARVGSRDCVRIPIMTGDQYIEKQITVSIGTDGVLEVFAQNAASCLQGAQEAAARIVRNVDGVAVFNYPVGGISGAKVGGKTYTQEGVTINEPFCPSVRGATETKLPEGAGAVIEFPLVAAGETAICDGLRAAIDAFADTPGVLAITAPAFGGTWGGRKLYLRTVLKDEE